MYRESQGRANRKYRDKTYDRIEVTVKKGLRDHWKACAEVQGLSLTAYITQVMEAACGPLKTQSGPLEDMPEDP